MKRAIAIADRASPLVLALIAGANMLFLALFLLVAVMAVDRAGAATEITCTGQNLMSGLPAEDKAAIEAEAAATKNGKGILWMIEKEGLAPSFLFGTMHVTDPRVVTLTPSAQAAYDGAGTVVIETTGILDQSAMLKVMADQPDLLMFTDATTLSSLLSEENRVLVERELAERGMSLAAMNKMKPWLIAAVVALPPCELARKNGGAEVLDVKLARGAQDTGKELIGLETVEDQFAAMASLPLDFHMKGLVETLQLGDTIDDVNETMIELWRAGDTGMFWPLFSRVIPDPTGGEGYADFEEAMITSRNATMAERAAPIIEKGSAFIAVGALHLPGEDGVIERLRRAGYTVTPAG